VKIQKGFLVILLVFTVGFALGFGLSEVFLRLSLPAPPSPLTLEQMYINAVRDAMVAEESEVCSNLTAIVESNKNLIWLGEGADKSVLVVTWTKYGASYSVGGVVNTTWGDTWVTVVPEIKTFFETHLTPENDLVLRAEQLLGLPIDSGDLYFVELWVRPKDLFRPSPDNEINDTTAGLTFPDNVDPAYRKWFNDQIIYSYFTKQYPWTRLGYTYDWGNPNSKFGLSEFVIRRNSLVVVKSKTTTIDYLKGTEAPNGAGTEASPSWYAQYWFVITLTIAVVVTGAGIIAKRKWSPRSESEKEPKITRAILRCEQRDLNLRT
jgi:hypothetical protein